MLSIFTLVLTLVTLSIGTQVLTLTLDTSISVDCHNEKVFIIGAPINISLPSAYLHNTIYHFIPMSYPNQYVATLIPNVGETIFGSTNPQNTYNLFGISIISNGVNDYLLFHI